MRMDINQYKNSFNKVRLLTLEYIKETFKRENYSEIFYSIVYSIFTLTRLTKYTSNKLTTFPDRIIGHATLFGVDISARVRLFVFSLLFFSICFIFYNFLIQKFKKFCDEKKSKYAYNFFGLSTTFIAFYLFGYGLNGDLKISNIGFLFSSVLYAIIFSLFFGIFPKFGWTKSLNHLYFTLSLFLAMPIFLFAFKYKILSQEIHWRANTLSLFFSFAISSVFVFGYLRLVQLFYKNWYHTFRITISTMLPVFSLIAFPFIGVEFYYILNSRSVFGWGSKEIQNVYIGLLFLLFVINHILTILKIQKSKTYKWNPFSTLYNKYAFILICIFLLSMRWSGTGKIQFEDSEWGNSTIAIQQFYNFNKTPLISSFPPHLLSDIFGPMFFSILSGYESKFPNDAQVYFNYGLGWLFPAVLIFYFVLKRYSSSYFALLFVFLVPAIEIWINAYYAIGFLGILYFTSKRFYNQKNNLSNWILFWLVLFLLFLYRIDLGVATSLTLFSILFLVYWFEKCKFSLKTFLISFLYSFVLVATVYILLCVKDGVDFIFRIKMIFDIMALEGQSNVLSYLYTNYSIGFYLTYFIVPISIFIFLLFQVRAFLINKSLSLNRIQITILFFSVFYFATFVRALFRHGWLEQKIEFIFSTGFIVFFSQYFGKPNLKMPEKNILSIISLAIIILFIQFVFNLNYYSLNATLFIEGYTAIGNFPKLKPVSERIERIKSNKKEFKNFLGLLDLTLTKEETFLIFNNKDQLYFLSNRLMPTYMGQVPLGYSSDSMQKNYLREIENIKAPLLVFEHAIVNGWDGMDGVPNTIRAYRIAEYFYLNYEPFVYADNNFVWVQKSRKEELYKKIEPFIQTSSSPTLEYVFTLPNPQPQKYAIGMLPFIWANYDKSIQKNGIPQKLIQVALSETGEPIVAAQEKIFSIEIDWDKKEGNYLYLDLISNTGGALELSYSESLESSFDNSATFLLQSSGQREKYLIRMSSFRTWMQKPVRRIKIQTTEPIQLMEIRVTKGD